MTQHLLSVRLNDWTTPAWIASLLAQEWTEIGRSNVMGVTCRVENWQSLCRPATKTEARLYMTRAGTNKRIAFLKTAVEKRYLQAHPTDKRSQLLTVSADVKRRLDGVFDVALDEINAKFASNK